MKERYILRKEAFGGLLKDITTGTHLYLDKQEYSLWQSKKDIRQVGSTDPPPDYLSAPLSVALCVTNRCKLRCKHCYNNAGEASAPELSSDIWKAVAKECGEMGVFEIRFTGGEPTLREDVFGLASLAQNAGITTALLSNGVWSKKILYNVLESDIERFYISLEGIAEANDCIRGEGSYDKALSSLHSLAEAGARTCISVHLRKSNLDQIEPLVDLAARLKCLIKFSPIRPVGRARKRLMHEIPDAPTWRKAVELASIARLKHPEIQIFIDFDLYHTDAPPLVPSPLFDDRGCHAARRMVGIDYRGNVYPCTFFSPWKQFIAGDIRKQTLSEIWQKSETLHMFRQTMRPSVCRSCEYFGSRCLGGCPVLSYHCYENLSAIDPMCFIVNSVNMEGTNVRNTKRDNE